MTVHKSSDIFATNWRATASHESDVLKYPCPMKALWKLILVYKMQSIMNCYTQHHTS